MWSQDPPGFIFEPRRIELLRNDHLSASIFSTFQNSSCIMCNAMVIIEMSTVNTSRTKYTLPHIAF